MKSREADRAWAALLRLHAQLVPEFDRDMRAACGLPLAWYDVLLELRSAAQPLRMTDLGDLVVLSRTRVSRIVDELAASGFVIRETNPDDARSSYVELTDAGRRIFEQAARVYQEGIGRRLKAVDPARLISLAETLEQLKSANEARR